MSNEAIKQVITSYSELLRTHQLNIELLATLEQTILNVQSFCLEHGIPFHDEKLTSTLSKVENLLNEIANGYPPNLLCKKLADESLHEHQTDADLTEPARANYSFVGSYS